MNKDLDNLLHMADSEMATVRIHSVTKRYNGCDDKESSVTANAVIRADSDPKVDSLICTVYLDGNGPRIVDIFGDPVKPSTEAGNAVSRNPTESKNVAQKIESKLREIGEHYRPGIRSMHCH